ncbi:FAD dependent oxidoreductase superfamily [Verticillium alfalfae VaMs.102]|uniref:FAD dependent oxidoreductase superfamily n=1 Tax=Verticillium alfalfae (strain VaMs.102 / ATCC MYA-4576 / FGSC 10136) TaxID=526221 RepID=C9SRX2_VERA1|nr:FAD dependent oxidoreductase superfamily [Verticillium alfalfae VaMs.102]EEY21537.1 FAD dependent oxidoreductase superfamily [Verticillium alfalfae VaMs.102]
MSGSPEGVYEPGVVDPGLPVANSTQPFWHSELHPLSDHKSAWPQSIVDVVIIGSGISGASIAHNLLSRRPDINITLIDARSLCSGATARNGGHIKTMTYAVWDHRKQRLGLEEAIKMTAFEQSHLDVMAHIVHANSLECDFVPVQGVDAYYDETVFAKAVAALQDMRLHAPNLADKYKICTDTTVLQGEMKLSARCVGAITTPAASVWPYKMVTNLLATLVSFDKVNIQTGTPVLSIDDRPGSPFATVRTSRGDIRAKAVVHATNGWLGHLLPELRPYISPVRGNVVHYGSVASKEDASVNAKSALGLDSKYSFWLRYADKDYDYLIQRQDGGIVVGRANMGRRATGDDSQTDLLPMAHLRGFGDQGCLFSCGRLIGAHH